MRLNHKNVEDNDEFMIENYNLKSKKYNLKSKKI